MLHQITMLSEDKKQRFLILLISLGLNIGSFVTLINSLKTEETWKIILAGLGFIGFFILLSLVVYNILKDKTTK